MADESLWRHSVMTGSEKKEERVKCMAYAKGRGCPIAEGKCMGKRCVILRPGE